MSREERIAQRPPRARQVTIFVAATAIAFDLLLTGFSYWAPTPLARSQFIALLDTWDLVKGVVAVLAMLAAGIRIRSALLMIFGVVLGLVVALEVSTGYALAITVLERIGINPRAPVAGEPAFLYGELAVLGGLALLALVALWVVPVKGRQLKRVRVDLLLLLAGLFAFSVGIGYYAELVNSDAWKIVEEGGERIFMSLILGYAIGLLVAPPSKV